MSNSNAYVFYSCFAILFLCLRVTISGDLCRNFAVLVCLITFFQLTMCRIGNEDVKIHLYYTSIEKPQRCISYSPQIDRQIHISPGRHVVALHS
jgi:hypothetical protein